VAWAGLAASYDRLASWGVLPSRETRPRPRAAAERALALDSSLVEPIVTLANVKMNYEWDWAGADRLSRQALELNPNYGYAHHSYATYLAAVGRLREAVAEARRAAETEPLSLEFAGNVAWKLYLARRYDEAESALRQLTAWYPNRGGSYIGASIYLQTGRSPQAIAELQRAVASSNRGLLELMFLGRAFGVAAARAEGRKVLDEMLSLSRHRYVPPEYVAIVYEGLGERDHALDWFEKAYTERSLNVWLIADPQLDGIRLEPRFRDLMHRMGLPQSHTDR
jgi:tetratricopeptide (TPR) repeat protein